MCECSTHMGPSLGISAETVVNQQSLWEVTLQTTAVFSNKLGNFKMEQQQYEPNAAHQVTNIIQAKHDNEKVNLKDAYNMKAAIALGVIHIICGFVVIGVKIRGIFPESVGIWFIAFFFVTGGLAIGGALTGNESLMGSLMVLTMVIAIIAAIFAGFQLIVCVLLFGDHDSMDSFYFHPSHSVHYRKGRKEKEIIYGLATAMSATMLIIAIASASLTCKPLCCRSNMRQGTVHYIPDHMPATYHNNPNLPTVQEP